MAKKKKEKIDGLSSDDLKKIHRAVRLIWSWSYPCRLVKKRSMHEDGFPRCENPKCPSEGRRVPKVSFDHIAPVGEVGGPNYIARMFTPSSGLQALCRACHDVKTRVERGLTPRKSRKSHSRASKSSASESSASNKPSDYDPFDFR